MLQLDDMVGGDGLIGFVTLFVGNLIMLGILAVNCSDKTTVAPPSSDAKLGVDPPAATVLAAGTPLSTAGTSPLNSGGLGNPGAGSADANVGLQSVHAFTAAAPPTPVL